MATRGKTYRTSSGKQVDFGALLLANETAPALGNMNVNARGDEIDSAGNITKSREQVMREYNELNTMVPQDDEIPEGTNIATADDDDNDDWQDWEPAVKVQKPVVQEPVQEPAPAKTVAQEIEESADRVIDKTTKTPTGGLAAAVAAAKKVETKVKPARGTEENSQPGVRRI